MDGFYSMHVSLSGSHKAPHQNSKYHSELSDDPFEHTLGQHIPVSPLPDKFSEWWVCFLNNRFIFGSDHDWIPMKNYRSSTYRSRYMSLVTCRTLSCKTKIWKFGMKLLVQQHIWRFEISVDHLPIQNNKTRQDYYNQLEHRQCSIQTRLQMWNMSQLQCTWISNPLWR